MNRYEPEKTELDFASICFKIYVACEQSDHRPSSFEIEHTEYMKKIVRCEQ